MELSLHTAEKTAYRDYWQHNAAAFDAQGCYSWMASQLTGYSPKRILDIGCGTAEGILALLKGSAKNIVALEENFDCIKATEGKLNAIGCEVKIIPRLGYSESEDGRHDLIVDQDEAIAEGSSITLIHADPLLWEVDKPLKNYIASTQKFDAVTVWLLGTYEMRRSCRTLDSFQIKNAADYRLRVQNKLYELADAVLKPGGVFHLVDRGIVPDTDELRKIVTEAHEEQASVTSLKVTAFVYRLYEEPTNKRISMTKPPGTNPTVKDDGRRAMHSVICIKP